jgi:hypothetical protein
MDREERVRGGVSGSICWWEFSCPILEDLRLPWRCALEWRGRCLRPIFAVQWEVVIDIESWMLKSRLKLELRTGC